MGRVDNKVSIVTGGALGIGRSACLMLAREGAKVAVTDILDDKGQELVGDIKKSGGTASYWHLDVTKEENIKKVFSEVKSTFGTINISSIYGLVSAADIPAYHASKGAVRLMTKTDALLYAQNKIRVNSVHPGFIWTELVQNYLATSGLTLENGRQLLNDAHPLGHPGEPEDVGYGVLYVASDESKFMTGSELVIDGGYTAR